MLLLIILIYLKKVLFSFIFGINILMFLMFFLYKSINIVFDKLY